MKRQRGSSEVSDLRKRCKELGIQPSSNPTIMQERIRLHEQGQMVVTPQLWNELPFAPAPMPANHHKASPVFVKENPTLLDVSHDVIRNHLFCYLDIDDVFSCLYVCKYLYEDAYAWLLKYAIERFGLGATPLAFTCEACTHTSYNANNIMALIKIYGSLENYKQDMKRQDQLRLAKAAEKRAIQSGVGDRYKACEEICKELGYPSLNNFFKNPVDRTTFKNKETLFYFLMELQLQKIGRMLKKMQTFINRGNPLKIAYSVNDDGLSPEQSRILQKFIRYLKISTFRKPYFFQLMYHMFVVGKHDFERWIYAPAMYCNWQSFTFIWGFVCVNNVVSYHYLQRTECTTLNNLLRALGLNDDQTTILFSELGTKYEYRYEDVSLKNYVCFYIS